MHSWEPYHIQYHSIKYHSINSRNHDITSLLVIIICELFFDLSFVCKELINSELFLHLLLQNIWRGAFKCNKIDKASNHPMIANVIYFRSLIESLDKKLAEPLILTDPTHTIILQNTLISILVFVNPSQPISLSEHRKNHR